MIHAFVNIKAERNAVNSLCEELLTVTGISEIFSVTGEYDIIAILRVKDHNEIARIVTEDILENENILETNTIIAFKAYSKKDLEEMWSIGFND